MRYWLPVLIVVVLVADVALTLAWLSATTAENCGAELVPTWRCSPFWQEDAPHVILAALAATPILITAAVLIATRRSRRTNRQPPETRARRPPRAARRSRAHRASGSSQGA
jgi:hypothetical protein